MSSYCETLHIFFYKFLYCGLWNVFSLRMCFFCAVLYSRKLKNDRLLYVLLSIYGCDQVFMFLSFPFTYCFNIIFWCFVIIPIKFTFYNIILQHSTKYIYQSFQTSRCYRRLLDFFF